MFTDWHRVFAELSDKASTINDDDAQKMHKACGKAALAAFVDNHNTGYYVSSYTTKLNPTMDDVLCLHIKAG